MSRSHWQCLDQKACYNRAVYTVTEQGHKLYEQKGKDTGAEKDDSNWALVPLRSEGCELPGKRVFLEFQGSKECQSLRNLFWAGQKR